MRLCEGDLLDVSDRLILGAAVLAFHEEVASARTALVL